MPTDPTRSAREKNRPGLTACTQASQVSHRPVGVRERTARVTSQALPSRPVRPWKAPHPGKRIADQRCRSVCARPPARPLHASDDWPGESVRIGHRSSVASPTRQPGPTRGNTTRRMVQPSGPVSLTGPLTVEKGADTHSLDRNGLRRSSRQRRHGRARHRSTLSRSRRPRTLRRSRFSVERI